MGRIKKNYKKGGENMNEKTVNEAIEKKLLEVKELLNEGMYTRQYPRSGCSCSSSSTTDWDPTNPPM